MRMETHLAMPPLAPGETSVESFAVPASLAQLKRDAAEASPAGALSDAPAAAAAAPAPLTLPALHVTAPREPGAEPARWHAELPVLMGGARTQEAH